MENTLVHHPQLGEGRLLNRYMGGSEWEVLFTESGRRFRLPAKEFTADSRDAVWGQSPAPLPLPAARLARPDSEPFRARQTLESLRMGIVPVQSAETLTIGLEAEKVTLDRAIDRSRERNGDVLAVIGDYGAGKSHFIELAAQRSLRANFLVASASLDLREVPPNNAPKIYEALVTSLRYPDTDEHGLAPLIQKALGSLGLIERFVALCPQETQQCPLSAALLALQDCTAQVAIEPIVHWLSGQAKPHPNMKICLKKPPRLYTTGETARQYTYLLTGISTLAHLAGYSGLAILIDESEHYSLLRAAQRERADSIFKGLIVSALGLNNGRIDARDIPDHARADYPIAYTSEPHLLFLFALTESADRMPVGTWLSPSQIVRLDDRFIEKDIREFAKTLLRYHATAHHYQPERERYEDIVHQAPAILSKALGQHRINLRQLIRTMVAVYDLLVAHADYGGSDLISDLKDGLKV